MLDLFEKISLGFAGLCGFLTLGLYLNLFSFIGLPTGIPPTTPAEFIGGVVEETPQPPSRGGQRPSSSSGLSKEDEDQIRAQLLKQGRKVNGPITVKKLTVQNDLYEHVSAEANWAGELQKAHSKPIGNGDSRLKLFNMDSDSLFKKFGFREGDVIDLIDGEIVSFAESTTHPYYSRAKKLLASLRDGKSISVTVTRKGRPVHVQFSLEK